MIGLARLGIIVTSLLQRLSQKGNNDLFAGVVFILAVCGKENMTCKLACSRYFGILCLFF